MSLQYKNKYITLSTNNVIISPPTLRLQERKHNKLPMLPHTFRSTTRTFYMSSVYLKQIYCYRKS